jgi:hypothetical protein
VSALRGEGLDELRAFLWHEAGDRGAAGAARATRATRAAS